MPCRTYLLLLLPIPSQATTQLSSTVAQLHGLNIRTTSLPATDIDLLAISNAVTSPSDEYLHPQPIRHVGSLLSLSVPTNAHNTFPQYPLSGFNACTYDSNPSPSVLSAARPPLVRLHSSEDFIGNTPPALVSSPASLTPNSPSKMSAIGIQPYDGRFDTGLRNTYTWPQFEMPEQFMPHDMNPGSLAPYDHSMSGYARSLSSSPPRAGLTPEQRELKRQRDHARRTSKTRQRKERSSSSNSNYLSSNTSTPELMPRSLPEYQSLTSVPHMVHSPIMAASPNMAHSPHLVHAPLTQSPIMGSPAYMSSYSPQSQYHSPIPEATHDMYAPVFAIGSNDFEIPAYGVSYTSAVEPSIQTYAPRPHSLSSASDAPSMYQSHHNSPAVGSPADSSVEAVRVVHSRPKPQCWEHGCNGRQFSTFSNLLRHQREKSGAAAKSTCPHCGAEFTRTTARNGHMLHDKCKQRRYT